MKNTNIFKNILTNIINLFQNKDIVFLLCLLIFIVLFGFIFRYEGFSMPSIDISSSTTNPPVTDTTVTTTVSDTITPAASDTKLLTSSFPASAPTTIETSSLTSSLPSTSDNIPKKFQYLDPIPEANVWNADTQKQIIDIMNIKKPDSDPKLTVDYLKTPLGEFYNNKSIMQSATQEEAQSYIDTGLWPWNDYVLAYIKKTLPPTQDPAQSDRMIKDMQKTLPNRIIYNMSILNKIDPQRLFLSNLSKTNYSGNSMEANETYTNKYWYCSGDNLYTSPSLTEKPIISTDYNFFPDNIKGFAFTNNACNPCTIRNIRNPGNYMDKYNDTTNTCRFKITDPSLMNEQDKLAYKIYMGNMF